MRQHKSKCACLAVRPLLAILICLLIGFAAMAIAMPATAEECTELADVPLELKSRAAPGLIGLVLENTRSLFYTITAGEGAGTYEIDNSYYEHVFDEKAKAGAKYLDTDAKRNHWKTQWSGFNTTYYNPDVTYVPWPRWNKNLKDDKGKLIVESPPADVNADPDQPRIWPLAAATFDMNAQFSVITQGTVTAEEETVDINPWGPVSYYVNWDQQYRVDQTEMSGWNYVYTYEKPKDVTTVSFYIWKYNFDPNPICVDTIRLVNSKGGIFHSEDPDVTVDIDRYGTWETINDAANQYVIDEQYPNKEPADGEPADPPRSFKQSTDPGAWVQYTFSGIPKQADTIKVEAFIPYYREPPAPVDPPDPPPVVAGNISVKRAHYYAESKIDNKFYLVNLNGSAATGKADYYQLKDGNKITIETTADLIPVENPPADILVSDYAKARGNLANWYQFYRSRQDSAIGALGQFLDGLSGVYFRLDGFPPASFGFKISPIKVTIQGQFFDETDIVLANLYSLQPPSSETGKLSDAFVNTGDFFKNGTNNLGIEHESFAAAPNGFSSEADFPFFTAEYGGACQQAFAILVTGGFWTTKPNETTTMASIAEKYYNTDFRTTTLENNVPTNKWDDNKRQHLVTYGISFGVDGNFIPDEWPDCNLPGEFKCPAWPATVASQSKDTIDDLWHSTVEGRGLFINAANPQELVEALKEIRSDIEIRLGSAAAVSTNSVQRQVGTHLYQGIYHSGQWYGDLKAIPVNADTGQIGIEDPDTKKIIKQIWSAKDQLDHIDLKWEDRAIFTSMPDAAGKYAGYAFNSNLPSGLLGQLHADPDVAKSMVNYLRGDRDLEQQNGGPFRNRASRLGDIVHSEPVYHKGVIYVGANDGMLHAFDATTGNEIFAYIPHLVFNHLAELADPAYGHKYYVNSTPYAATVDAGGALLVGGLGKGGKGYYCLDIANVTAVPPYATVKWEFTTADDADMGYSYGRPLIFRTLKNGWVVVFGNGYNSSSGEAILYVLDVKTGEVLHKFETGAGDCNGFVGDAFVTDVNFDGNGDFVYAGDLKGNMWKFDLRGDNDKGEWRSAYMNGTVPEPLTRVGRPITTAPDVMMHCRNDLAGYIVVFGTGQYVNEADFNTVQTESLYGIWDWQEAWEILAKEKGAGDGKFLGLVQKGSTDSSGRAIAALSNAEQVLLGQQAVLDTDQYIYVSDHPINYWKPSKTSAADETLNHVGWYFDLPATGERLIRNPIIRDGTVVAIGSIPVQTPCSSGGSSVIYMLNACAGGDTGKTNFIEHDGEVEIDGKKKKPSGLKEDKMLFRPVDIGDNLYSTDDDGGILITPVPNVPSGANYWHEVEMD